ncbi:MAG: hypothetical protein L6427_07010 [Actinomycetia bacterium]|nr:hypothetical protein [Actinomycetes bacterium]
MEMALMKLYPQVNQLYKDLQLLAKSKADEKAALEARERYQDLLARTREVVPERDEFASLKDAADDITYTGLLMLVSTLDGVIKVAILP